MIHIKNNNGLSLCALGALIAACGAPEAGAPPVQQTEGPFPLSREDPASQLPEEFQDFPAREMPIVKQGSASTARRPVVSARRNLITGETETGSAIAPETDGLSPSAVSERTVFAPGARPLVRGIRAGEMPEAFARNEDGIGTSQERLVRNTDTEFPGAVQYVKLFSTFPKSKVGCSGTLIEDKFVLTAAHCIYGASDGGFATNILVVPGLDGTYMPYGSATAVLINYYTNYLDYSPDSMDAVDHDFALLTLNKRIGRFSGVSGYATVSDDDWDLQSVTICGYPGSASPPNSQWCNTGPETSNSSMHILFDLPASPGSSGAGTRPFPIFPDRPAGVFIGVTSDNDGIGCRLTNSRFADVGSWINANQGQAEVGGSLGAWTSMGTSSPSLHTPAAISNGTTDFIEGYWRDKANGSVHLASRLANGSLGDGGSLGGNARSEVAAISRAPGLVDLFITDSSTNSVFTKAFNGAQWLPSQTGWWSLGGTVVSAPAVVSWGSQRLDVFARVQDGSIWHNWWAGDAWGGWEGLGGILTENAVAISRGANLIDVFARDPSGNIRQKSWNGSAWVPSQTGWGNLGKAPGSRVDMDQPVAVVGSSTRMDVFSRDFTSGVPFVNTWTSSSGWSGWQSLSGVLTEPMSVTKERGTSKYMILGRGTDMGIWWKEWAFTGSIPSGWTSMGGDILGMAGVSAANSRVDVAGRAFDNSIRTRFWDGATWH